MEESVESSLGVGLWCLALFVAAAKELAHETTPPRALAVFNDIVLHGVVEGRRKASATSGRRRCLPCYARAGLFV
jgi:hypothetical protein